MFSENNRISIRQMQAMLLLDVFGMGILVLPRTAAEYAGQDGWASVALAALAALVLAFILASAGGLFPSETFMGCAGKVLTRPVAALLSLGMIARLVAATAMELRVFGEIIKLTMLHRTPCGAVCAAMLFAGAVCAAHGCETRARAAQVLVFLAFIPLIAVFIAGLPDVDFSNLMPVLASPPGDIALGGFHVLKYFGGIELVLLIFPFVNRPAEVRRGMAGSVLTIGLLIVFITIVTIAKFGPFSITRRMWPALQMMDSITLPGSFIERQDALVMSFWIISVFAVTNAGLFYADVLARGVFGRVKSAPCIAVFAVIVFALSFLPEDIPQVYAVMDTVLTFNIIYMFAVPLLMLAAARLRGIGGGV